jgi:oxygen-independent coproporphyrinogen-3 oxidase
MKLGELSADYFRQKFGVDVLRRFAPAFARLAERQMLELEDGGVRLTDRGLLQVDSLLPEFYEARFRHARYT